MSIINEFLLISPDLISLSFSNRFHLLVTPMNKLMVTAVIHFMEISRKDWGLNWNAAFIISFFLPFIGLSIDISLWVIWLLLNYDNKAKRNKAL